MFGYVLRVTTFFCACSTIPQFWDLDDSDDPKVSIVWPGEDGKQCDGCSVVLSHDKTSDFGISMPGNRRAPWYILPTGGIQMISTDSPKFWFEIAQNGTTRVEDNGGDGFPLQKKVVLSNTSCVSENNTFVRWDIAVSLRSCPFKYSTICLTHETGPERPPPVTGFLRRRRLWRE
jgi:hypothetical protein